VKPLEIVFFMRSVKSQSFFEQMKGRGVRVMSPTEFQAVTPDAKVKTHFVVIDAVGRLHAKPSKHASMGQPTLNP
jgi:type I restriction enzyme R subunit